MAFDTVAPIVFDALAAVQPIGLVRAVTLTRQGTRTVAPDDSVSAAGGTPVTTRAVITQPTKGDGAFSGMNKADAKAIIAYTEISIEPEKGDLLTDMTNNDVWYVAEVKETGVNALWTLFLQRRGRKQ